MIHKDGYIVIDGKIAIYPSLTESAFLSSDLGKSTELQLSNAGYHTLSSDGRPGKQHRLLYFGHIF